LIWTNGIKRSSGKYRSKLCLNGVTLINGAACSASITVACLNSRFFSSDFSFQDLSASRKSCLSTAVLLFLAAISAASLQTFAISAPENPGVCLAKSQYQILPLFQRSKVNFKYFCTLTEYLVSLQIFVCQIDLRINALSNTSALLVAAKTITLELVPKPSISVSN
jgi:hypothetical protein